MKVLVFIKNLIIGILGIAFFAFAIAMTLLLLNYNDYGVTQFDNTSLILIKEKVSSPNYQKGDLVLVEGKKLNNINVGDEIFVYTVDSTGVPGIDLGIVGEVHLENKEISFENGSTYSNDLVIGEASKVYNEVGTYLSIVTSQWGFLFIILIPCFLIFVLQFYALIVEIKYGNEEVTS